MGLSWDDLDVHGKEISSDKMEITFVEKFNS
jgi:hypothetical protein